jgi:hypothetical protein
MNPMPEAEIAHTNPTTRTLLLVVMLASGGAERPGTAVEATSGADVCG